MMRKTVLSLVLLVTGCAANGALVEGRDPFKGPVRGFARYLDAGHYTSVGMTQSAGKNSLQVMVVQNGQVNFVGHAGDKGEFKLGDNTITLAATGESQPVTNATRYQVFTQWIVSYELTPAQLLEFSRAPLAAVKVSLGDQFYQLALSDDDAALIRQNAASLASTK